MCVRPFIPQIAPKSQFFIVIIGLKGKNIYDKRQPDEQIRKLAAMQYRTQNPFN